MRPTQKRESSNDPTSTTDTRHLPPTARRVARVKLAGLARLSSLARLPQIFDARLLFTLVAIALVASVITVTAFMQKQTPPQEPAKAETAVSVRDLNRLGTKEDKLSETAPQEAAPQIDGITPKAVTAVTYPFTTSTGVALDDMSSGTTTLISADSDDGTSASLSNIGFDFWYDGVRFTQFGVNANGFARLGALPAASSIWDNSANFATTNDAPKIAPYYDDLWVGNNGKVHFKTTGSAPNRKLIVEWQNEQIPRVAAATAGAGTFQMWLFETTGVIEFVYGSGIAVNSANSGYSVGLQSGAATNFASVTTLTNTASYATANNTQSDAISSGRAYIFTPNLPTAPTGLSFTSVTASGMTLNWTDNASNEVGYAIYRSTDGTNYSFVTQTAANAVTSAQSGLTFSTTYFWKVYAVTEGGISSALSGSQATTAPGNISSTGAGGLWSAAGTWVGGVVPTAGDNVTIVDGATVTIDPTSAAAFSVTVGQGTSGILQYDQVAARTLTVTTDVTVAAGGTFKSSATGSTGVVTTNALSIGGNLTNNGTLNFSTTAGAGGTTANAAATQITFTGASDATFDCSAAAAVTNLKSSTGVTLNKGTSSATNLNFTPPVTYTSAAGATSSGTTITVGSTTGLAAGMFVSQTGTTGVFAVNTTVVSITNGTQFVVSTAPTTALSGGASVVTASKFAVQGASLLTGATAGFLSISNGTFKVGGTNTFSTPYFNATAYTIPSTGGFWLNNANATVTGHNGSPANNGLLRISAGTFNVGTASGNAMTGAAGAVFTIEGGTANFSGRLNPTTAVTYTQSSGTVNICTVGNASSSNGSFGLPSATSTFTMSGGTINLVQASTAGTPLDYQVSSVANVTGGTLNVGTAATATNFSFRIQGAIPNLVINNTTNAKTALLSSTTNVFGDITVNTGTTLNAQAATISLFGTATNIGNVTNNGTITNTSATGANRFQFSSTFGAETYSGTGTFGSGTAFSGINIANSSGVTISAAMTVTRVNLFSGAVTTANNITLGTGGASAPIIQVGGTVSVNAGSFNVAPTFNIGTGGLSLIYTTANAETTGNEIPGTRSVANVTISNATGATLAGGGLAVTSTLTLTTGNLTTSAANLLTVTNAATAGVSGGSATSYVNGPLARTLPASLLTGSTYTFPVGKSAFNLLELVNPTTNAGGTVTVQAEEFDANSGGTAGTGITTLNTNRYCSAALTSGGGNFTNTTLRLTESPLTGNRIGQSATQAGTYNSIGGTAVGSTLLSNTITSLGFFNLGVVSLPGGTYTVGAGGTYGTLTLAAADYNSKTITGPVIFSLTDANYSASETFPITFNKNAGASATNTLTISPASGVTPLITGSNATALIDLNGATNVIFDGSNSGGLFPIREDKPLSPTGDLTIRNTSVSGPTIRFINDASSDTVKNATVEGAITTSTSGVVLFSTGATVGNQSNTLNNNAIRDLSNAAGVPANLIYSAGTSAAIPNKNNTISNNQLQNFTANGINTTSTGNDSWTISGNTIFESAARSTALTGITFNSVGTNTITLNTIRDLNTSSTVTGMLVQNAFATTISRNKIFSIPSTNGSTSTLQGIRHTGGSGLLTSVTLANNQISIVPSFSNSQAVTGIEDDGFTGNVLNVYFNSVFIGGTATGSTSWAFRRATVTPTTITVTSNIFFNNRTAGGVNHFAAADESAATGTWSSNFNLFAGTGTTAANFMDYGTSSSGTPLSFTTWKAGPPARDAASIANTAATYTVATFFADVTTGDLHLRRSAPAVLNPAENFGTTVAGVTTDFDSDTRAATPDIGADEVMSVNFSAATYRPETPTSTSEGGTAVITVNRTSGAGAAATINFSLGGTAVGGAACGGAGVDYVTPSLTLNFAAGDTAKSFNIVTCSDGLFEGPVNETVLMTLTTVSGDAIKGSPDSATLEIVDGDSAPTLAIDNVSHNEGSPSGTTSYVFTVTKTGATALSSSVNFTTVDGSATQPGDYTSNSGTLTFPASLTTDTQQITVLVNQDTTVEPDETFTVNLNTPSNATILTANGTGTIINDDTTVSVAVTSVTSVMEDGATNLVYTFTRNGVVASALTANFSVGGTATFGTDYTQTGADTFSTSAGTVTFLAGSATAVVTIDPSTDSTYENDETVILTVTAGAGYTPTGLGATGTITNDDAQPTFSIDDITQVETDSGTTNFVFTVTKTGATDLSASVDFTTQNGSATTADNDYVLNTGTLSFAAAVTTKQITVVVNGDTTYEANETFNVHLSNANGATILDADGAGTITNDDAPPTTLVVNTTSDHASDGFCLPLASGNDCTLREAILAANSNADVSTINFNIPAAGVQTITPATPLPTITQPVTINGYTQPLATANTLAAGDNANLLIELDGTNAGVGATGLDLTANNSSVRGLVINRFDLNLVRIGSSTGCTVAGNFLGTNASGTTGFGGVATGVFITQSSSNVIGGVNPADRNLISGNGGAGVHIAFGTSTGNLVQGNYIGTRANGTVAAGNGDGVFLDSTANGNTVGGTVSGSGNVISGNLRGVVIIGAGTAANLVQGNLIGVAADGSTGLGNSSLGILISDGGDNVIGGLAAGAANTIANNGGDGVFVLAGTGNSIRANSIHDNSDLGIDLGANGVTANDPMDADSGANNLQNFPVLTSATVTGSTRKITGTLNSTPSQSFFIDFYTQTTCDPSGNGEGQTYLGSVTTAATDGSGDVSFTFSPGTLTAGQVITATATDASGNTSEFSACRTVVTGAAGLIEFNSPTFTVNEGGGNAAITVRRVAGTNGSITAIFDTSNGTATAGSDYTAVNGFAVNYADGETGSKTINIPITDDGSYEGPETVNLSLGTTVVNAPQASTSAVLTIVDNDAPPTGLVVNTTADTNDGFCSPAPGGCTLREAINAANFAADANTITFNIPAGFMVNNVFTIMRLNDEFSLTGGSTTIDGSTQTAFTGDTNPAGPEIVIDGTSLNCGPFACDGFAIPSSGNVIRSLVINNFTAHGITMFGGTGNTIQGNFIGTDPTGTVAAGNTAFGITSPGGNIIGGLLPGEGNVISGNGFGGLALGSSDTVKGNFIGTNATGTAAIGNSEAGIVANVGGGHLIEGNLISGNNGYGIEFLNAATDSSTIRGNKIGTDASGTLALGNTNHGIRLCCGAGNNTIGGTGAGEANIIAFNNGAGVVVHGLPSSDVGATGNRISGNSIFSNGGLGIDLGDDGVTPNDFGDGDPGPDANMLQNFPVLLGASVTGSTRKITGTLNTTPNSTSGYVIEFFNNPTCDGSLNGEGKTYIGSLTTGNTDANGNVSFIFNPASLTAGDIVTATATDNNGNTSEFSQCKPVGTGSAGEIKFGSPTYSVAENALVAHISITRVGGSDGSITANFSTSDGTATTIDFDYVGVPSTPVTFTDGDTTPQQIDVTINNDATYETDETVNLSLTGTSVLRPLGPKGPIGDSAVLTITNEDAAPTFSIDDVSHLEGSPAGTTSYVFTVTKTGATALASSVNFSTVDGSATQPSDYTSNSGTLNFPPSLGISTQQITVLVNKDTTIEPDEAFTVHLDTPVSATISDPDGTGTITNDDFCSPQAIVYVDDDWAAVTPGTDPDGVGPATNFGCDSFATIQGGVNGVTSGGTVIVRPGTYAEAVLINKPLTLNGAQVGANANTRFAAFTGGPANPKANPAIESIITAAATAPTSGANDTVHVMASNVTIDGFVVDGNNAALAQGGATVVGGINTDSRRAIQTEDAAGNPFAASNTTVRYNVIQNFAQRGVELINGTASNTAPATTGNVITQNRIRNFGLDGIVLAFNAYADITFNTVNTNDYPTEAGIWVQDFLNQGSPYPINITSNNVTVGQDNFGGIWINLAYLPTLNINTNTVNAAASVISGSDFTYGIYVTSLRPGSNASLTGNIVGASGGQFDRGIALWNLGTGQTTTVTGGTVGNSTKGVSLHDNDPNFGLAGSNSSVNLSSVSITGPAAGSSVGIFVDATGSTGDTVAMDISGNTSIINTTTATSVVGTNASANIHNNSSSIHDNSVGIDVNGGSATIISNNLYANSTGLRFTNGATGTAHFNRIISTTTAIDNPNSLTLNLENNWWGCNAGPGNTGCGAVTGTGADFDPWIVLLGSATPSSIAPGGTSTVAADMTHNSAGAVPVGTLPDIPDSFSATHGTMNPTSDTVVAGADSSLFTSTDSTSAVATITVDNQNTNVNITVVAPSFTIDNVTHLEGSPSGTTPYVFTVTKSGATAFATSVNFSTVNGTATLADNDYQANSGTLTFGPTDTTMTATVLVNKDTNVEADEAFTVHLDTPVNATIADADGTGTITNDDFCTPPATVYVDDDWAAVTPGTDPDGVGPATNFGCDSFATIQGGVNGVTPGGTVNVAAGNYPEQVVISKSLTLTGAGAATTTITTPATLNPGLGGNLILVQVDTAAVVNMSNITVAGPRVFNACSAQIFYGVYAGGGANLNLHDAAVKDIRMANPSLYGCQDGIAIRAGSQALAQSATLTVNNDTISGYQKGAIVIDGTGTTGTVQNSVITGFGPENLAQNAIQIGRNAGATVTGNTITGNECTNPVCGPDPLTQQFGTGVLIFSTSAVVQVNNNTISNNDTGVYNNAPSTAISGNTMAGNRYNGIFLDEGDASVTGNTLSGPMNVGVAAVSFNGNGGNSSGTLTSNTITGAVTGLQLLDETNADAFLPQVTAHFNRIISTTNAIARPTLGSLDGQNQMAIHRSLRQAAVVIEGRDVPETAGSHNTANTPTVAGNNLENNWWGCNAGPGNTGCGAVGGTATVDFNPWFVLSGSATPNSIAPGGTSNVAADMTKNSDAVVPAGTLPDLPIAFSATNGTMNPTSGTVSAGSAASTFTSTNSSSAIATLSVDNQNVDVPITVVAPSFTIDNVTHLEGSPSGTTSYVFTVTKSGATAFATSVNFSTVNGTATLADNDYQANSGTLSFGSTDTTMPVTVLVNKDTNVEADEAFTVHLDTPVNATIADADGTGTITNDDFCSPQAIVYVDDDWAAVTPGTDPDGVGPAMNFGCDSFATIQEGIDGVTSGGTVIVYAGTYNQASSISLNKSLTLRGPNFAISPNGGVRVAEALITGTPSTVLRISLPGSPVTIEGFKFDSAGVVDAYDPALNVTIRKNIYSNGISGGAFYFLNGPTQLTLDDNHLTNAVLADNDTIFVAGNWNGTTGTVATITNNVIENTPTDNASGMNLSNVSGTVSDNQFTKLRYYGVLLANNSSSMTISGNVFDGIANPDPTNVPTWGAGVRFYTPAYTGPVNIKSNTFKNSYVGVGVRASGGNLTGMDIHVNFNRFIGNTFGIRHDGTGPLEAQNNWWGCNAGPGNAGCDSVSEAGAGNTDFDPWIVLGVSATPNTIGAGGTSTVTADMTRNSDGATPVGGTVPPMPVAWSATNGTMAPPSGTITAGQAMSTFTSTNNSSGSACAMVDNQQLCTPITVSGVSFAINNVTHNEGDAGPTSYVFTVTKSGSTALSSSVNFTTQDGTATLADNDYVMNSNTLTFGPSDTTMQITVVVNGDTNFEPNEAFNVHLSGEINATISDADGTGTITNDDQPSISGHLNYLDSLTGAPNIVMTLTGNNGFVTRMTTTDANGDYTFTSVPLGNDYTVTPSRVADPHDPSITAFDASQAARFDVHLITLTPNEQTAGDSSNNGQVTAFDASQIARYEVSISTPASIAGSWKFTPGSLSINNLSGNQGNQNLTAILVGDITGNWIPHRPNSLAKPTSIVTIPVALPNKQDPPGGPSTIPINVGDTTGQGIGSFAMDISFNQAVLMPQATPFDTTGTLSSGWLITPNTSTPGHLILNGFSTTDMTGQGVMLKLKFDVVGAGGSTTPLTFVSFNFNEGTPGDTDINGFFTATSPTAATAGISGQIVDGSGLPVAGTTVTVMGGTRIVRAITDSNGYYKVENLAAGGFYTVTPTRANYVFAPASRSFSLVGNKTDAVFTGLPIDPESNPLESPEFFIRQQYLDFLGREPEQSGLDYWSGQLRSCGQDPDCINTRRLDISAAFYIAQEFQDSGLYIYDMYEGALGRRPDHSEYAVDRRNVVGGPHLERDKAAFARRFVERADFQTQYPLTMNAEVFVDALLRTAQQSSGLDLGNARAALITLYNSAANTNGGATDSRSLVLRSVAEGTQVKQTQYNPAFVLMEYYGYLGRNPDGPGYDFWLQVLNDGDRNNYRGMVCSFITSAEYQRRFSPIVTRSNVECATSAQSVGRKHKAGKTKNSRG